MHVRKIKFLALKYQMKTNFTYTCRAMDCGKKTMQDTDRPELFARIEEENHFKVEVLGE